jgi:KUP system potassium uptake protein
MTSPPAERSPQLALLGALGVVFGDIGTSPLYALHVAFTARGAPPTQGAVYGFVSLVFWTLTLVVSVKYVTCIMRIDNRGEGGILALIALVQRATRTARSKAVIVSLGLFGAALFYGDGMITPAISVLSAVEGLDVAAPAVRSLVVPLSVGLLIVLFAIQRFGTGVVGLMFGPIMAVWFAALAASGLRQVVAHPQILEAVSPSYAVELLGGHPGGALVVLGAVVLTVTGAEALYADMGHFGRSPIRRAWYLVVFPALILNYMGQGALVVHEPRSIRNPFFLLVPAWGQMAMVVLATVATLIASQAVISGAFSLSHQAVQLGLLPRLTIHHTSEREPGQVYAPAMNWVLCAAVIGLVLGFRSSDRLASAYGIAVTGTMAITTILFFGVVRARWKKPLWMVIPGATALLTVDLVLFAASLTKVEHGGWLPVTAGVVAFTIFTTWRTGREIVMRRVVRQEGPLRGFVEEAHALRPPPHRAPGAAVFLSSDRETTPLALRDNLKYNHVLHQSVLIISIEMMDEPHVAPADRLEIDALGYREDGITLVTARFGYHDALNLSRTVAQLARRGLEREIDARHATYFLSRITVERTGARRTRRWGRQPGSMRQWRRELFIAMWRNQAEPVRYFGVPDDRTVTMGSVVEI